MRSNHLQSKRERKQQKLQINRRGMESLGKKMQGQSKNYSSMLRRLMVLILLLPTLQNQAQGRFWGQKPNLRGREAGAAGSDLRQSKRAGTS